MASLVACAPEQKHTMPYMALYSEQYNTKVMD